MFIDSRSLPDNERIHGDVCIVGGGAAGITIARRLAGRGFSVCLLESGGREGDADTQSLYGGRITGRAYYDLDITRLRYFGGTTNHWTGRCAPLDSTDFSTRPWVPESGWPFDAAALEPFYRGAQELCQLGPFEYDSVFWEKATGWPRLPLDSENLRTRMFQHSPPTRFAEAYAEDLNRAANITVYLFANVLQIALNPDGTAVSHLKLATIDGKRFSASARYYIVAAGGIENPRLLLLSNEVHHRGIGNTYDLVGRYFMEHLHFSSGVIAPVENYLNAELYRRSNSQVEDRTKRVFGVLVPSRKSQEEFRLTNGGFQLTPVHGYAFAKGIRSLKALLGNENEAETADGFLGHISNIVADLDDILDVTVRRLTGFGLLLATPPIEFFEVYCRWEPSPNRDSRVSLIDERDRFGQNRVELKWLISRFDKEAVLRAHDFLGAELGRTGFGRLRVDLSDDDEWPEDLEPGHHHMGTTRLHNDPKQGVVDENCRVHGLSNLYIAGSSVFPTAGYANPTLTIVAMALRLADHIKGQFR